MPGWYKMCNEKYSKKFFASHQCMWDTAHWKSILIDSVFQKRMDWQKKKKVIPWNEMQDMQSCLLREFKIEGRSFNFQQLIHT